MDSLRRDRLDMDGRARADGSGTVRPGGSGVARCGTGDRERATAGGASPICRDGPPPGLHPLRVSASASYCRRSLWNGAP